MGSYVYPGATHKRTEHALGSYAETCEYIRALWYNSNAPIFRSIMRKEDLCAVLLASLLHDVGYYPLAHDLEDCEEWRSNGINHEAYACRIIDKSLRELVYGDWGVDPEYLKKLMVGDQTSFRLRILHSIIDGPIDTDKMDYLLRDGMHLGLPYAECIDKEWFLRNLTIAYGPSLGRYAGIAVTDKGRVTAESIAFARYMMFSVAYWHHTNRAVKSMIKYALGRIADGKKFDVNEHYSRFVENPEMDDTGEKPQGIPPIRQEISSTDAQQLLWIRDKLNDMGKAVIDMIFERRLFKRLIVIDGSRLDTESLYEFFDKASDSQVKQVRNELENRLSKWISEHYVESVNKELRPLVLIDVPRMQHMPPLYYVTELGNIPLSQSSIVWKELAEMFSQSVGKVRIFIHPEIAPILRQFLSRDTLLEMVSTILESPIGYHRR